MIYTRYKYELFICAVQILFTVYYTIRYVTDISHASDGLHISESPITVIQENSFEKNWSDIDYESPD